jgi:HK97 family phage major capsid protein
MVAAIASKKKKKTPKRSGALYGQIVAERESRQSIATLTKKLVTKVRGEKRDMSAEEREQFDKMAQDIQDHNTRIEALESIDEDEDADADADADSDGDADADADTDNSDRSNQHGERRSDEKIAADIMAALEKKWGLKLESLPANNPSRASRSQAGRLPGESHTAFANRQRRNKQEYFEDACNYLIHGKQALLNARAVQADDDIVGGYLVLPEKMSEKILKKVDNLLKFQQLATTFNVPDAQSLGVPTIDENPDAAEWTTEIASIPQDSAMRFGKRSLTPFPLRKRLLVSEKWLRMAMTASYWSEDDGGAKGGSPEQIVIDRLAYMIAVPRENAFMIGNGSGRPLGVFIASSRGISTARDINTGSATGITYVGLVNTKMSLKSQYLNSKTKWFFHRDAVSLIMKLVDDNNRPLLNFNTLPDMPTQLLQHEVIMSEYVPNTFTNGLYCGLFGNPEYYAIANSLQVTVKKAEELYAETAQVGFFIACESDGMPMLEEPFSRMKCST